MTTGTATAAASGTPSAQSLSRFNRQAAQQGSQAAVNLALLEAETTQAGAGGTPQARLRTATRPSSGLRAISGRG